MARRFADDQLRIHGDGLGPRMRDIVANQREKRGGGDLTHAAQRLMNGGQRRMVRRRGKNVVEAENGNISWERADRRRELPRWRRSQ